MKLELSSAAAGAGHLDNPASCRVADKAGYPFKEVSPAQPPLWYKDGHIHLRVADSERRPPA